MDSKIDFAPGMEVQEPVEWTNEIKKLAIKNIPNG